MNLRTMSQKIIMLLAKTEIFKQEYFTSHSLLSFVAASTQT